MASANSFPFRIENTRPEVFRMTVFFEHLHTVLPEEIDPQGHVNNVAYVAWMQAAAVAHSRLQGWPNSRYRERGWAWVARSHFIEYRRPAFLGDEIVIRTWVADMQKYTSRRKYEMFRENQLLARAETNWAFVAFETQKLLAVPEEVARAFEIGTSPTGRR